MVKVHTSHFIRCATTYILSSPLNLGWLEIWTRTAGKKSSALPSIAPCWAATRGSKCKSPPLVFFFPFNCSSYVGEPLYCPHHRGNQHLERVSLPSKGSKISTDGEITKRWYRRNTGDRSSGLRFLRVSKVSWKPVAIHMRMRMVCNSGRMWDTSLGSLQ